MNIHRNFACFAPLLIEGVFHLELDPRIKLRSSSEGVELEMKSAIVIRHEAELKLVRVKPLELIELLLGSFCVSSAALLYLDGPDKPQMLIDGLPALKP